MILPSLGLNTDEANNLVLNAIDKVLLVPIVQSDIRTDNQRYTCTIFIRFDSFPLGNVRAISLNIQRDR